MKPRTMLLAILVTMWLGVIVVVTLLCVAVARADRTLLASRVRRT